MRTFDSVLLIALGAVAAATLFAVLAPFGWPFELFSHFRIQYAALALVLAVLLAWRRGAAAGVLALALAAWHAAPGVQRALAGPPVSGCSGPSVAVATVNLNFSNHDKSRLLDWLEGQDADVIVLQEVTPAWAEALAGAAAHPHRYMLTRGDQYGIGVMSRHPLLRVDPVDLAGDGLPALDLAASVDGHALRVLGLHTRWPVLPDLARARDRALEQAATLARTSELPVVLAGDLNLTPDSPAFGRLLESSGLRDAAAGRRWRPTWLAGFWPLALRIDHLLVSQGVCVEQTEVGPPFGSDHRPVTARLRIGVAGAAAGRS